MSSKSRFRTPLEEAALWRKRDLEGSIRNLGTEYAWREGADCFHNREQKRKGHIAVPWRRKMWSRRSQERAIRDAIYQAKRRGATQP